MQVCKLSDESKHWSVRSKQRVLNDFIYFILLLVHSFQFAVCNAWGENYQRKSKNWGFTLEAPIDDDIENGFVRSSSWFHVHQLRARVRGELPHGREPNATGKDVGVIFQSNLFLLLDKFNTKYSYITGYLRTHVDAQKLLPTPSYDLSPLPLSLFPSPFF